MQYNYMDYKEFYTDVITFNKYIEFRIMNLENKKMFSLYAENIQQIDSILEQYDKYPYNIYYGVNTRPDKVRKSALIPYRTIFYFDIEKDGVKPDLGNQEYYKELSITADYIIEELNTLYSLKPIALVESGRGMHLYYKINPLGLDFEQNFKLWYKNVQLELDKDKPVSSIKFLDSTFDRGRIGGAIISHHNKYPEKPLRKIVFCKKDSINSMEPILNNMSVPKFGKKEVISKGRNRKWTDETIFNAPEWKVLELGIPILQGYEINNKLLFALKLLMDKYDIKNRDEVSARFQALGYGFKDMSPMTDDSLVYSTSILSNWCLKHWEFCLEKNFLLPYAIPYSKSFRYRTKRNFVVDDQCIGLKTPTNIIDYIKKWNNKYCKKVNGTEIFYIDDMKENVMRGIENPKLKEWVGKNKFLDKVKLVR